MYKYIFLTANLPSIAKILENIEFDRFLLLWPQI